MKATITLLAIWLLTLLIEIPIGANSIYQQQGFAAAVGPVIIESLFVVLIVLFIIFGRRGRRWSYTGAMVIGIVHMILSAAIYFQPGGPPLALGAWLTAMPALVAIAGAAAYLELRKRNSRMMA